MIDSNRNDIITLDIIGVDIMRILTVEEVSKILKVSTQTVRAVINGGELPAKKVGRYWRILEEDLHAFMKDR